MKTAEDEEFERIEREAKLRSVPFGYIDPKDITGTKESRQLMPAQQQPAQQQALTNEQCRGKELLKMVFEAMSYGNAQDRESARLAVGAALAVQPAQQRKPLTDKEVWSAIRPLTKSHEVCEALVRISMAEYRAIEAAHGIKENT